MGAAARTRRRDALRTQSLFREVNDRVAELSRSSDVVPPRFICECLRVDCCATIVLELAEYAKVRSDPAHFIVLAEHEDAETQDVLERRGDHVVVQNVASRMPNARARSRLLEPVS